MLKSSAADGFGVLGAALPVGQQGRLYLPMAVLLGALLTLLVQAALYTQPNWSEDALLVWQQGQHSTHSMHPAIGLQQRCDPLAEGQPQVHLPWQPLLGERQLQQGLAHYGSGERLQRVAQKLLAGQPISVVTLGGSVTRGMGASSEDAKYASRFFQIINASFPHKDHYFVNKGIGGTSSGIFSLCAKQMVPEDADLITVEFTYNEPANANYSSPERKGYEQLLRKLLQMPGQPAIMLMHHYAWWFTYGDGVDSGLYYRPAEEQLGVFGQYYDLPSVSLRSAVWRLMNDRVPGFKPDCVLGANISSPLGFPLPQPPPGTENEYFYADRMHPADPGHAMLAELLSTPLARAVQEAGAAAGAGAGAAGRQREKKAPGLPPPMVPGNAESPTSLCAMQEDFKPVVRQAQGFAYRAERLNATTFVEQKWGWTGLTPGDWAEMVLDTREDGSNSSSTNSNSTSDGKAKKGKAIVWLSYLKTYQSMGTADIECMSGCKCDPLTLDGSWARKVSLMQVLSFKVSQHQHCRIRVTVSDAPGERPTEGHKVTLMGVMVSHFAVRLSVYVNQLEDVAALHL